MVADSLARKLFCCLPDVPEGEDIGVSRRGEYRINVSKSRNEIKNGFIFCVELKGIPGRDALLRILEGYSRLLLQKSGLYIF